MKLGFEHIFAEMPVVVTFESDWRKAHDLLEWDCGTRDYRGERISEEADS